MKNDFPHASPVESFKTDQINQRLDQVYRRIAGRQLYMDIFLPKNDEIKPANLLIHGGGWRSGTKSHMVPMV